MEEKQLVSVLVDLCDKLGRLTGTVETLIVKQLVDARRLDEWDRKWTIGKTALVTSAVFVLGYDRLRLLAQAIGLMS